MREMQAFWHAWNSVNQVCVEYRQSGTRGISAIWYLWNIGNQVSVECRQLSIHGMHAVRYAWMPAFRHACLEHELRARKKATPAV